MYNPPVANEPFRQSQEDGIIEIDLHEVIAKLRKHHRLILNFIYVCAGVAFLYSLIARPVYKSTARILVENKAPRITKVDDQVFTDYEDRANYFNSQIEVLKSRSVGQLAYEALGGYQPWGSLRGRGRDSGKLTKDERIGLLLKRIKVSPVRMTQIIEVSAEDVDQKLAAEIVNNWVNAYIVFSSMDQLIQRKSELESEIEQNLKYVKEKHPIIQGLRSEIEAIDAKIKGEKQRGSTPNVKILDAGQVAKYPVRPKLLLNLILALFLGGFSGVAFVFLLENIDQSIKNPSDIENFLHMPCLAAVPPYQPEKDAKESFPCALVSAKDSRSVLAERFRSLRTGIIYSNPDLSKKVLLVTSAGLSEGKTTSAVNLATAFAKFEGRVILVEGDLRKPALHAVFNKPCENGLTELLASEHMDFRKYVKDTGVANLDFISCGAIALNPAELLGSKKLGLLIEDLSKYYDRIIFDAPPVLAATDAVVLSTKVDAVILVCKSGLTHRQAAIRSVKLIHSVHARVLGSVLNMVRLEDSKEYAYYNYYLQNAQKV